MKQIAFALTIIMLIASCNDFHNYHLIKIDSSLNQNLNKVDTLNIKVQDANKILKLIKDFSTWEFNDSRKTLMEQGSELKYQVSEIKKLGNTLKYTVKIPDIEGTMIVSCIPNRGELMSNFIGDPEIAKFYYNQNKLEKKWGKCNATDFGEQCETYEDMEEQPLKTYFKISILNQGNTSFFTFIRNIMPK
jgi:hypothetical protein